MTYQLPKLPAALNNSSILDCVCAGTILKHKDRDEYAVVIQCWEGIVAARRSDKQPKTLNIKPKHFELFSPVYDEWIVVAWGPRRGLSNSRGVER